MVRFHGHHVNVDIMFTQNTFSGISVLSWLRTKTQGSQPQALLPQKRCLRLNMLNWFVRDIIEKERRHYFHTLALPLQNRGMGSASPSPAASPRIGGRRNSGELLPTTKDFWQRVTALFNRIDA